MSNSLQLFNICCTYGSQELVPSCYGLPKRIRKRPHESSEKRAFFWGGGVKLGTIHCASDKSRLIASLYCSSQECFPLHRKEKVLATLKKKQNVLSGVDRTLRPSMFIRWRCVVCNRLWRRQWAHRPAFKRLLRHAEKALGLFFTPTRPWSPHSRPWSPHGGNNIYNFSRSLARYIQNTSQYKHVLHWHIKQAKLYIRNFRGKTGAWPSRILRSFTPIIIILLNPQHVL